VGYTSTIVRTKLAKEGKILDSPETTLAKLMDEGYTHVAIPSLHTIPGEEFHNLYQNAHLFTQMAGGFEKLLSQGLSCLHTRI
jgi:sirohydrochlorin cobaltochelatase